MLSLFINLRKRMKQTISLLTNMIIGLLLLSAFSSCVDNERNLTTDERTKLPKEQFFDFNMNQTVAVTIDYGFNSESSLAGSYRILFEIYDQNPIESYTEVSTDGQEYEGWRKKSIDYLYCASTDVNGKYTGEMTIPSNLSKVWLYSDFLGTVSPIELTIGEDHTLSFNQNAYLKELTARAPKSRGITDNQHNYLSDWSILPGADWDENGRPNNLEDGLNIPPADILYYIKYVFRKVTIKGEDGKNKLINIRDNYPDFFDEAKPMSSDIPIVKPTEVNLVFVNSSAAWYNTVGYYTYPTGTTLTPADASKLKKTIVFPNVSPVYKTLGVGALVCGEEVKLKYWNEEKKEYEDEFPAGVTIGWCLQGMGFRDKPLGKDNKADIVKGMGARYSTRVFNSDEKQRTVSLRDSQSNRIVAIGFEDNVDLDYCDAIFYIHTSVQNAVSPDLPALPEEDEAIPGGSSGTDKYTINYSGILAFEDLWPKEGDYDMNDLIIQYNTTVSKMVLDNRIYKIEDKFTVKHCGGYLANGFGYQFDKLSNSNIKSVVITGPSISTPSKYMDSQMTEPGQSHPTILLFDDMNIYKNITDDTKKQFTVEIELDGVAEKDITPPYNPFIFISSDKSRGKEVHLINYAPTDKVDNSYLGTGKDLSRPEEQLYYVSADMMPFAINMPINEDLVNKLSNKANEGKRIDALYPKFASWAQSHGTKDKDWYLK